MVVDLETSSPPVEREQFDLNEGRILAKKFPTEEIICQPIINRSRCNVANPEMYEHMYWRSLHDAENFWRERAIETLRWARLFTKTQQGSFKDGDMSWFLNGKLNVCDNCVDRWAEQYPNRVALIYEGDEPKDFEVITYKQLLDNVCRFANLLKSLGVRKGDTVSIYLPMIPEIAYAMLACARIGAVHSVIFAGFSAQSLSERIRDASSKILVTVTCSSRGGRRMRLKDIADEALKTSPCVEKCIVFRKAEDPLSFVEGRDLSGDDLLPQMRPYCPLECMDSEDVLFILYTSGSTGKPKGVCHTSAGYLLHAALTLRYIFDFHSGDVFGCVADCGWITGHTYVVYGPLANGGTTVLFQSTPTYPNPGRYWAMCEKWHVTQLYTAPTAIRALMRHGDTWPQKFDISSLRVLGSVGEPINPEAWRWYFNVVGKGKCSIVDTYWQTETGGHVISPIPGATAMKPGCAMVPFFGVELAILDPNTAQEKMGNDVFGVLCIKRPWPGMCRTVHRAHQRLLKTYMTPYPNFYFTGDGAYRDRDGHYWITGRVDDTLNVSGHRLCTAEIEHALVQHPSITEAAVVGIPHDLKGTAILCFVVLKFDTITTGIVEEARAGVRHEIGPLATPDYIIIAKELPKTLSGKILRRLLRQICVHSGDLVDVQTLGDTTSLSNPSALLELYHIVKKTLST